EEMRRKLYLNGKGVWIFAFGVSISLHLIALPFIGRFLEACPTCGPLTITLPPIYARIHNPSQTSKDLEKRKAILQEKKKVTPQPENKVERKVKPLPQHPFFAQKWLDTTPPQNKPAEPGGGAAQVLTKESPGAGEFVVGGIPKPEPGAKGPGLGGSGTAPGVGGSG
ncbi:MAG: hypothetical protein H5T69_21720, partial [Chloroflexi bacterium]|nr:hypothetical protein [Chloroflexota bacterium]